MMKRELTEYINEKRSVILKIVLTLGELVLFIIFISEAVLLIGALQAQKIYNYRELGINKYFLTMLISGILILILPVLVKALLKWSAETAMKLNLIELKSRFFNEILNKNEISIDELAEKYGLTPDEVRNFIFDLIQRGFIKGTFEKTITGDELFIIAPGYEITHPDEAIETIFSREIGDYLTGYIRVPIKKIAKYFGMDPDKTERLLKRELREKNISGYIDEDIFYREWPDYVKDMEALFKKNERKCPHCSNFTDATKPYCAWCGERLKKDSEMDV